MNAFAYPEVNSLQHQDSVIDELLKIKPLFIGPKEAQEGFNHYLRSSECLVKRVIPKDILAYGSSIDSLYEKDKIETFYEQLIDTVPCASWAISEQKPYVLSVIFLCPCEFTHGVGRFICDICSRWIIPGKQLSLSCAHSLAFSFKHQQRGGFFIQEVLAKIDNPKDLSIVLTHLPSLTKEVKLNILAVSHARRVISARTLTLEQKKLIIQENISALLERPLKDAENNIYDQMHDFFIKVLAENKVTQIKEQIAPLLEFRPQVFERDIFHELQQFVFSFKDKFSAIRDLKHLTRIISYFYIFRKISSQAVLLYPNQRHIHLKIFRTNLQAASSRKKVIGVLVSTNLLCDNEIFEERHVIKAIQSVLLDVEKIPDSTIIDKRANNNIRLLYLEFAKKEGAVSTEEIKLLRERLPRALRMSVESVINPIFMPRNEEEIMKNIVTLNNQLKYIQDLPQVIISFHKQSDLTISFTVVLVRVLRPESIPAHRLFETGGMQKHFSELEVKRVGLLRKKHPKEANVFEIEINKSPFLRSDFSVDLYEARKEVLSILSKTFGEVRDYNGGMISKQTEALSELKRILLQINIQNDFLVENFFYSLFPKYMQSIIDPLILKRVFLMLLEATEHNYSKEMLFLKTQVMEKHFVITIGATNPTIKHFIEEKIENLQIEPSKLTSSYLNIYDISCLSYILQFNTPEEHETFARALIENIKIWKETIKQSLPSDHTPSFVLD